VSTVNTTGRVEEEINLKKNKIQRLKKWRGWEKTGINRISME